MTHQQMGQSGQLQGQEMNDRDHLADILNAEKFMASVYNISASEANSDAIYNDLIQIMNDTHQTHRQLYKLMHNKGWYRPTAADQQEVTQAATQYANSQTQFPGQIHVSQLAGQQQFNQQQYPLGGQQYWSGQQMAQPGNQQFQQLGQQMPQFAPPYQQPWQTMPAQGPTTPHIGQHQPSPWRRV